MRPAVAKVRARRTADNAEYIRLSGWERLFNNFVRLKRNNAAAATYPRQPRLRIAASSPCGDSRFIHVREVGIDLVRPDNRKSSLLKTQIEKPASGEERNYGNSSRS